MKIPKILIIIAVIAVLVLVLMATGILKMKFNVSYTPENKNTIKQEETTVLQEDYQPPEVNVVEKKPEAKAEPKEPELVEFTGKTGEPALTVEMPAGWSVDSRGFKGTDLIIKKTTPEIVNGNQTFVNLAFVVDNHAPGVTEIKGYQGFYRRSLEQQYPEMEILSENIVKVGDFEALVLEAKQTNNFGVMVHQVQYLYYLNDVYAMSVTGTSTEETWEKNEQELIGLIESVQMK